MTPPLGDQFDSVYVIPSGRYIVIYRTPQLLLASALSTAAPNKHKPAGMSDLVEEARNIPLAKRAACGTVERDAIDSSGAM